MKAVTDLQRSDKNKKWKKNAGVFVTTLFT